MGVAQSRPVSLFLVEFHAQCREAVHELIHLVQHHSQGIVLEQVQFIALR